MRFLEFRTSFFDGVCFSTNQAKGVFPGFQSNNLSRWTEKGLLVKLRNGYYTFHEYLNEPGAQYYTANRIYKPSYVSLHSALAFYGIIPEAVVQITSVTALKTEYFKNNFGEFSYKSVSPNLMFGYEKKKFGRRMTYLFATPEKALLDLLYLYPFYDNADEMRELRLDEDVMHDIIAKERLELYSRQFGKKALDRRVKIFRKVYGI